MRRALGVFTVVLAFAALAEPAWALRLIPVASGFQRPVHVASTRADRENIYVVEQRGVVKRVWNGLGRRHAPTVFLDIRDLVAIEGAEQGLLSLAFDPSYATNRRFYVYYTNNAGDIRVVAFRANSTRTRGVRTTRRVVAAIDHPPATNHNGGQLSFRRDGYLYFATGDGGGGCDPGENAQDLSSRLGKLLRVNAKVAGATPRIVGYGLRNPWRFSFDRANGNLYLGDVGQGDWEEIDFVRYGASGLENYGWDVYEGPDPSGCTGGPLNTTGYRVRPVHSYPTSNGCAVTGGFVYRGSQVSSVRGRYFFGDYCSGRVWSFVVRSGRRADLRSHPNLTVPGNLSSFGEGPAAGLYFVSHNGGRIYLLGRS